MQNAAIAHLGYGEGGDFCVLVMTSREARSYRTFKNCLLAMKLTIIFLTVGFLNVAAKGVSQTVTFSGKNVPIDKVFMEVERQTGFVFFYNESVLRNLKPVSIEATNKPLKDFLNNIMDDQPLSFRLENNAIVVSAKRMSFTFDEIPPVKISGTVVGVNNQPLSGANVVIKGTKKGTTTDGLGIFSIEANKGDKLIISSIGYADREIIVADAELITINMTLATSELDEVVVNKGYYTESKKLSTGNVSRVSGETINAQPVTNVMAALIARVPGLEVTQGGGMPGSGFKIRIRGQNSIAAGNNPLFIIDGVPFASESLGSSQVSQHLPTVDGGSTLSPFNTLNPGDIASIEVLKDADATAIYGSRGANGVILITTRKGKAGETQYDLRVSAGFSKVTRTMDMLKTEEYLAIRKEAFANDGVTDYPDWAYDLNGTWDPTRYTDWQKELIGGTAKNFNTQLGVSGGSANTQFLVRGGFQRETTVYPGDFHYDRGSMLVNINHRSANGKMKLSFSTTYGFDDNNMSATDLAFIAPRLPPNAPKLYNEDGTLNWADNTWQNPVAELERKYDNKSRTLNSNLMVDIQLLKDVQFKTNFGFSDYRMNEYLADPSTKYNPVWQLSSESSSAFSNIGSRQNWIIEPQLNWKKQWGKNTVQTLAGATYQQQLQDRIGYSAFGFPSNSLIYDISTASYQSVMFTDNSLYKYHAIFGRVNYNLSDKYLFNFTARRDGSSRFSRERQFASFGAVGAAWIFSNEPFMQKALPFISFGKLRSSYGITGNDQIGDYQFLNTYTTSDGGNYQGITGLLPQRLYNADFGWESNKKLEAALEIGLWNDRIFVIAAWYRNRTSSQLVGIPLSGITGFTSIQSNLPAKVQNTGWELELQASIIRKKSFTWTTSVNISIPRNKLVSFPNLEASSYANQYLVGQPLTITRRYKMSGIDPATGVYQYLDANKDGQLSAAYDRVAIRNLASQYFGGVNNSFLVGKWQLDVFMQFVKKTGFNYLYTGFYPGMAMVGTPAELVKDRWSEGKTSALLQVLTAGGNSAALNAWNRIWASDAAISDTYFVRLKNISVAYQLPEHLLKRVKGRLFIQGQNLITITDLLGADPESEFMQNLPPLKTISVGAQLTF